MATKDGRYYERHRSEISARRKEIRSRKKAEHYNSEVHVSGVANTAVTGAIVEQTTGRFSTVSVPVDPGAAFMTKDKRYYERHKKAISARRKERRSRKQGIGATAMAAASTQEIGRSQDQRAMDEEDFNHCEQIYQRVKESVCWPGIPRRGTDYADHISLWKTPYAVNLPALDPALRLDLDYNSVPLDRNLSLPEELCTPGEEGPDPIAELRRIRQRVADWCAVWGGVSNWSDTLEGLFTSCLQSGAATAMQFIVKVHVHSQLGRMLLGTLRHTEGLFPAHKRSFIRLLWLEHTQTLEVLVWGLSIIDTRLSILRKSIFSLGGRDFEHLREIFLS